MKKLAFLGLWIALCVSRTTLAQEPVPECDVESIKASVQAQLLTAQSLEDLEILHTDLAAISDLCRQLTIESIPSSESLENQPAPEQPISSEAEPASLPTVQAENVEVQPNVQEPALLPTEKAEDIQPNVQEVPLLTNELAEQVLRQAFGGDIQFANSYICEKDQIPEDEAATMPEDTEITSMDCARTGDQMTCTMTASIAEQQVEILFTFSVVNEKLCDPLVDFEGQ